MNVVAGWTALYSEKGGNVMEAAPWFGVHKECVSRMRDCLVMHSSNVVLLLLLEAELWRLSLTSELTGWMAKLDRWCGDQVLLLISHAAEGSCGFGGLWQGTEPGVCLVELWALMWVMENSIVIGFLQEFIPPGLWFCNATRKRQTFIQWEGW